MQDPCAQPAPVLGQAPGAPCGHYDHLYLSVPDSMGKELSAEEWSRTLRRELEIHAERGVMPSASPASLLVGGGAPSALGPALPARVGEILGDGLRAREWSVEVGSPPGAPSEDPTAGTVREWVRGGVTRVCIRADPTAPSGGWDARRFALVDRVRGGSPPVLAADVLVGGPGATPDGPLSALDRLAGLGVAHVSVYEHPAMSRTDEDTFGSSWRAVIRALDAHGFVPADLVNHALPEHASRYSRALLLRRPLLGLGPGAGSFRNPERSRNVSEWWEYRSMLAVGKAPIGGRERLSRNESRMERIWCRLQTSDGLRLPRRLGHLEAVVAAWVQAGWAIWDAPRIRLTPEGWLRVDGLAVELASRLSTPRREHPPP